MSRKYKLLSYPLNSQTPLYGDTTPLRIKPIKQIAKGDSCNNFELYLSNHCGTHMDAPRHFDDHGRSLFEYAIDELIFQAPCLVDCPKEADELIMPEDLRLINKCDLLLIRTGFYRYRGTDKYRLHNPGVSPDAAKWLRSNYPGIRAIGIDTISFSAFQKREAGREAHKLLLSDKNYPGKPVLLIEDLNLSEELKGIYRIIAIPLFVEGIDSMAATVICEYR